MALHDDCRSILMTGSGGLAYQDIADSVGLCLKTMFLCEVQKELADFALLL